MVLLVLPGFNLPNSVCICLQGVKNARGINMAEWLYLYILLKTRYNIVLNVLILFIAIIITSIRRCFNSSLSYILGGGSPFLISSLFIIHQVSVSLFPLCYTALSRSGVSLKWTQQLMGQRQRDERTYLCIFLGTWEMGFYKNIPRDWRIYPRYLYS